MVTEPDLKIIKNRIVDIITAALFDDSGEERKADSVGFVTIQKGLPDNNHFKDIPKPACFIANASNLEIDSPFGPVTDVDGITSEGASRHDFTFQIQIFHQGSDATDVDDLLDELQKRLKETLKANYKLVRPEEKDDPLVTQSLFTTTTTYSAEQDGKVVDGRIFLFTCLVISA